MPEWTIVRDARCKHIYQTAMMIPTATTARMTSVIVALAMQFHATAVTARHREIPVLRKPRLLASAGVSGVQMLVLKQG